MQILRTGSEGCSGLACMWSLQSAAKPSHRTRRGRLKAGRSQDWLPHRLCGIKSRSKVSDIEVKPALLQVNVLGKPRRFSWYDPDTAKETVQAKHVLEALAKKCQLR